MTSQSRIRGNTVLPARREALTLHTSDGLALVGEVALPPEHSPVATLVCLHPLPTHGGMRWTATCSARRPGGHPRSRTWPCCVSTAGAPAACREPVRASSTRRGRVVRPRCGLEYAEYHDLPQAGLLAWSFGSDLALRYGLDPVVVGRSCSPATADEHRRRSRRMGRRRPSPCRAGPGVGRLRSSTPGANASPAAPRRRSSRSRVPSTLWVGDTERVLDEVVARVAPGRSPLPTTWPGPVETADTSAYADRMVAAFADVPMPPER